MDIYYTRKATDPLNKVYTLLGISSDNPNNLNTAGLLPNYKILKEVFRKLIEFSASDQISVET